MPRKLKTYQTSLGFFDLAIAAPSMKAALEAWGSNSNLFHQGVAKESSDPEIIAAATSKPGVILRRPVGSHRPFTEYARLPTHLSADGVKGRPAKPQANHKKQFSRKTDDKAERKAALAFEREQSRREADRRKEEVARAKQHEQRQRAITKAEAALAKAKRDHEKRVSMIDAERAALEKRALAEDARWEKQKEKLKIALRRSQN
jgi:colicin import membrane protein